MGIEGRQNTCGGWMGLGMEQGTYILGRRDPKQGSATLHLVRRQLWEELLSHFARSSCGFVLGLGPPDTLAHAW